MAMGLTSVRLGCGVVSGAVVLVHVAHARVGDRSMRLWHVGHVVMAVGMALMFLMPRPGHPGVYAVGAVLFGAVTAAVVLVVGVARRGGSAVHPLWVMSVVDLLVMTYMLLPPVWHMSAVTAVGAVYLTCECLAWAVGRLLAPARVRAAAVSAGRSDKSMPRVVMAGLVVSPVVSASLALMAAVMGYMLVSM